MMVNGLWSDLDKSSEPRGTGQVSAKDGRLLDPTNRV